MWLGLVYQMRFGNLAHSVIGAMFGYLSLWSIYHLFKLITGKEAMGYGDFKLSGALGSWLDYQAVPLLLFIASISSVLLVRLFVLLTVKHKWQQVLSALATGVKLEQRFKWGKKFAFGPFLIVGFLLTALYYYLSLYIWLDV